MYENLENLQKSFALSVAGRVSLPALIKADGPDALMFLQGQFTQELRSDRASPVTYGLWLNQKGRVLADSFVLRLSPTEFVLVSPSSPASVIRERLDAYLIADEVELEDVTAAWTGAVLAGPAGRAWAAARGITLPGPGALGRVGEGWIFRGRRAAGDTWELLQPAGAALCAELPQLDDELLRRARILAGFPAIPQELGEQDLPNEAGLEAVAISYTKGCYLGQEVMARLHSLGRVRRSLQRVIGRGPAPAVGANLYHADKAVGTLRAVASLDKGWVGLVMLSLVGWEPGQALAAEPSGSADILVLAENSHSQS